MKLGMDFILLWVAGVEGSPAAGVKSNPPIVLRDRTFLKAYLLPWYEPVSSR